MKRLRIASMKSVAIANWMKEWKKKQQLEKLKTVENKRLRKSLKKLYNLLD